MTEEIGSLEIHVKVLHRIGTTDLIFEGGFPNGAVFAYRGLRPDQIAYTLGVSWAGFIAGQVQHAKAKQAPPASMQTFIEWLKAAFQRGLMQGLKSLDTGMGDAFTEGPKKA